MDIFDYIFTFTKLHGWFGPAFAIFAALSFSAFICIGQSGGFNKSSWRRIAVITLLTVLPVLSLFGYMMFAMCRYSFSFDIVETQKGEGDTVEEMVRRAVKRTDGNSWSQYTTVTHVDTSKSHAVRVIGYSRYIYDDESYANDLYDERGHVESKTVFKCRFGKWAKAKER